MGQPVKIAPPTLDGDPYAYAAQCIAALGRSNSRQANARKFYERVRSEYGTGAGAPHGN